MNSSDPDWSSNNRKRLDYDSHSPSTTARRWKSSLCLSNCHTNESEHSIPYKCLKWFKLTVCVCVNRKTRTPCSSRTELKQLSPDRVAWWTCYGEQALALETYASDQKTHPAIMENMTALELKMKTVFVELSRTFFLWRVHTLTNKPFWFICIRWHFNPSGQSQNLIFVFISI